MLSYEPIIIGIYTYENVQKTITYLTSFSYSNDVKKEVVYIKTPNTIDELGVLGQYDSKGNFYWGNIFLLFIF